MKELGVVEAWLWYDALQSIRPRRIGLSGRASAKYKFLGEWEKSLLDALTDGRPILANFHVAGTFHIGSEVQHRAGALIYNCLFRREGRTRMNDAIRIHANPKKAFHG